MNPQSKAAAESIFSPQNMLLAVITEFLSNHPEQVDEFLYLLEDMFLPDVATSLRQELVEPV
jgi:hypothetical protein